MKVALAVPTYVFLQTNSNFYTQSHACYYTTPFGPHLSILSPRSNHHHHTFYSSSSLLSVTFLYSLIQKLATGCSNPSYKSSGSLRVQAPGRPWPDQLGEAALGRSLVTRGTSGVVLSTCIPCTRCTAGRRGSASRSDVNTKVTVPCKRN